MTSLGHRLGGEKSSGKPRPGRPPIISLPFQMSDPFAGGGGDEANQVTGVSRLRVGAGIGLKY